MLAAVALWAYAAVVALVALPAILGQSVLWQFSAAIVAGVGVPTAILGGLVLHPRLARGGAFVATLWMAFLAWSWIGDVGWLAVTSVVVGLVTLARAISARGRPGAGPRA